MKKLIYLCVLLLLASACKKEEIRSVFDQQPEERAGVLLAELESALLDAPYGWKASLNTVRGGGYGFYVHFNEDETLEMLSDFNVLSRSELKESTWRVKWGMTASLIFDTYNYIAMPQDPNPNVNGGTGGQGLQSDVEFEYLRINADSVILKGKRYKQELVLVKLDQATQEAYRTGQYVDAVNAMQQYFALNSNNYIEIDGLDPKVEVIMNHGSKTFDFQYMDANDQVYSYTYKYNYDLDGINFNAPIEVDGHLFSRAVLEEGELYLYDQDNQAYLVQQNPTPLSRLEVLYSPNGAYRSIMITGESLPAGVSSEFNQVFEDMAARFRAASGRYITSLAFTFQSATSFKVDLRYSNSAGTSYLADASFDYTYEDGVLTLSNYNPSVSNTNWNSRIPQLGEFIDWIQSGPFQVDWVSSSDPTVSGLGGLYKVDNPGDFFYGTLE